MGLAKEVTCHGMAGCLGSIPSGSTQVPVPLNTGINAFVA